MPPRLATTRLCASSCARRLASTGRRIQRPVSSTSYISHSPADRLGNTPLHLAIDSAHAQTAAVLIDVGGADRRRPNADGVMPEEMDGVGGLEQKRVREFLVQSFGPL